MDRDNASQYFTIEKSAFIWKMTMNMIPMVPIIGRDKFVNGKGRMTIKLLSLFNITDATGEKVDEGSLQRYLAEICWFPSAALSEYIKWQPLNDHVARATLTYNGSSGSVDFLFTSDGSIKGCEADRFQGSNKDAVREKWQIVNTETGMKNGIKIPLKSEVCWRLKNADFTWYKLEITDLEYNKPELYPT